MEPKWWMFRMVLHPQLLKISHKRTIRKDTLLLLFMQSGVEGAPGDPSMNTNESAGNLSQECVPNREEASSDIRSCKARRTSGEYSYVYRPKRRKITVCNAPQMRTRDTGDYGDYEENGDFVYDYSADYECASDMSEGSYVTDQQRTLVEVLNYCQVMYAAIQRLDKKFDVLHRRVTEMHQGRTKPMFFKPRLMTMSYENTHQMPLTKMKIQKTTEKEVRIRMPPPDQQLCSSPLRIRVEKEPLNVSIASKAARLLPNPQTMYSCTRGTSPPLPTIHSVQSLQEPSMQGSAMAIGISDFVPAKAIVEQDTRVPKPSGANDTVIPTGRLYQGECSFREAEAFVNANATNGTEQQSNFPKRSSCVPSSSAANMSFDYLGNPRRNIKVPAAFLIKARQKSKPKYAARYLIRMIFPRDVLMCSNVQGDKARGIKPLDPNRVTGLREFLCTQFPTYDLSEEGKDWKICVTSINSMIRSLRCEIQRGANITNDNGKALGYEGAQVCVNLDSDGEDELTPSLRPEEPKITTEPQQQEWKQQDVTTVPESDKQRAFEPKETLGNPARQVQLPYSAVYVAKQRSRPELAARCLVRHLFPEEVLIRSNVYGNLDRGIAPLDCNKISAIREFLEEVYPVFDLRENGRDWKACVAAINSSIRSIRHDLRKSLPGYYKKQHPQYFGLYYKKQPGNQSNKIGTPHSIDPQEKFSGDTNILRPSS
ncbi:BEN domain-containing protein 2-like isoform X2 [Pristis pectinata]|uniref:BEN domain-containing protein 2-like isoform X2 n=1 Tax=Pristis pectinata TaxID=685728 RepID=UPI00223D7627|nr:BEN domain-containing protein 2-like isoform X2 [Pristis pectinata]